MLCLVSHTWREHQSNLRHLELPVASHTGICPADLRLREMDSVWFPCFASANCAGKTNLSQLSSQALHAHSTWNLLQKRQMFFWQKLMFKVSLKKCMVGWVSLTFKIIPLPYSTTVEENSTFTVRWEQPGQEAFSKDFFSSLSPRCFFPRSKTTSRSSQMLTSFMVLSECDHKIA